MLKEAHDLVQEGHSVIVVFEYEPHAEQAEERYVEMYEQSILIRFETPGTATAFGTIDWGAMCLRTPPDIEVDIKLLVDHHVIESRFTRVLEMLHRYDRVPQYASIRPTQEEDSWDKQMREDVESGKLDALLDAVEKRYDERKGDPE
jgi:hypothetical protein